MFRRILDKYLYKSKMPYFKFGLSPSKKNCFVCLTETPLKMMKEKCFSFHLKSSFCSKDVLIFVLNFWSHIKNDLIRKVKLISELITLQPGYQTITIHILPNISRGKWNQIMRFSLLIEC